MKKTILVITLTALTFGCSAAQKQAEQQLGIDLGSCTARVALGDLNRSPAAMLADVASICGEQAITNPTDQQHLIDIFTSAQASATKAGAKFSYATADGGK